jgi:hypothetical protein
MAAHQTVVALTDPLPPALDAGSEVTVRVQVTCDSGCDLRRQTVEILDEDRVIATGELSNFDERANVTRDLVLHVPEVAGEYRRVVRFARHDDDRLVHEESSLPITLTAKPHEVTIATWGIPSPVPLGRSFTVRVGVRCSSMCRLTGSLIEIHDDDGRPVGSGRLGETVWPGTSALYWTEVELAPEPAIGVFRRSLRVVLADARLPHDAASASFTLCTDGVPEHRVAILVVDRTARVPVPDVEVQFGRYLRSTEASGVATVDVPKGTYELGIRKEGYSAERRLVGVFSDLVVEVEALPVPTRAEMEERMAQGFGYGYPWL